MIFLLSSFKNELLFLLFIHLENICWVLYVSGYSEPTHWNKQCVSQEI